VFEAKKNAVDFSSHGISIRLRVMGKIFPAHARYFTGAYGQTFSACHHQFLLRILVNMTFHQLSQNWMCA
jgi:hypothetical protein